jgi:hypothetical protein
LLSYKEREKETKTREAQKSTWHTGRFVVPLSCGDDSTNCSTHAQKEHMASSEAVILEAMQIPTLFNCSDGEVKSQERKQIPTFLLKLGTSLYKHTSSLNLETLEKKSLALGSRLPSQ